MSAVRRAFGGTWAKETDDTYFRLKGSLGPIGLTLTTYRTSVCSRVVTDRIERVERVPDPDAVDTRPLIDQTVVEEVVEWQCHPLLEDEPAMESAVAS